MVKLNETVKNKKKGTRYKRKRCSYSFYHNQFTNQKKTCRLFNCIICNEEIFSINKKIEDFSNEIIHKEYIIILNNSFCLKDPKNIIGK